MKVTMTIQPDLSSLIKLGTLFLIAFGTLLTSCTFTTKPLYYDDERLLAESAVSRFHNLHNQGQFEAIYQLMDKPASDNEAKAQTLAAIKTTFETVGRVKNLSLGEHRVSPIPIPGFRSQVKLVYETEFEKGTWTEFFVWNIKDNREAVLAEYRVVPTATGGDSPK